MFVDSIRELPQYKDRAISNTQISWMDNWDSPHPMQCERFVYERVRLGIVQLTDFITHRELESPDNPVVANFLKYPEIEWAAKHSLDGLHLIKDNNLETFGIDIAIFAYLEPKHATLWRLKHNGIYL